jgi:hypothetical protein
MRLVARFRLARQLRFNCQGMVPTVLHLQRLAAAGVGFHCTAMPNPLSTQTLMVDLAP